MKKYFVGKYRSIISSVALFILLDASVLGMNFYISFALSGDATAVSQAGQLQMMSQRLMKSIYELHWSMVDNGDSSKSFNELKNTYQNFDETLTAFQYGGMTSSSTGELVYLKAIDSVEAEDLLRSMSEVWQPFENMLNPVINLPEPVDDAWFMDSLIAAEKYVAYNNLTLLQMSSKLAENIESKANNKARTLRLVQTVGISLAIINFIIIIYHFIGQLRRTDEEISTARKETRQILDFVGEGLFLLDKSFRVSGEHSRFSEKIFADQNISGIDFIELIRNKVSPQDLKVVEKYLHLMLDNKVKESLTDDLNPLRKIRLSVIDKDGRFENKYLNFSFSRIFADEQVSHILVTVKDITERVQLQKVIETMQEVKNDQLLMLTKILEMEASEFNVFISNSLERVHAINAILQQPSRRHEQFEIQINHILTELHKLKGESSMMNMHNIAADAHSMESLVIAMRGQFKIEGDDFLPLAVKLKELLQLLAQYKAIALELNKLRVVPKANFSSETFDIISKASLQNLVDGIAIKSNKKIALVLRQKGRDFVPGSMLRPVRDIVVQLVKNSACHGIEPINLRAVKPEVGRIQVQIEANAECISLIVRDDGAGIDIEKLKQKVIATGKYSEAEIDSFADKDLVKLIFENGVSTFDSVDQDAGRGIGMLVILQMLKKLNGKVNLQHEAGSFCQFTLRIPLLVEAKPTQVLQSIDQGA